MDLDGFVALLNQKNPEFSILVEVISDIVANQICAIERKDYNLLENALEFRDRGLFILADKELGVVFGLQSGNHQRVMAELYRYHTALNPNVRTMDNDQAASAYMRSGMGWFISSVHRGFIELDERNYKPDKFDRDPFIFFDVDLLS